MNGVCPGMDPVEFRREFNSAVDRSTEFISKEFTRLKTVEEEYRKLLQLIEVIVEHDVVWDEVVIRVSKRAQKCGRNWKEILELAMKEDL